MLDLGIKKLEKFSLPEEIVGERVVLVPRRHEFDEALFELIDSSRNFLREYLFWVDDTRSVDDVRKVTDIFQENWKNRTLSNLFFWIGRAGVWSVPGEYIRFLICIIMPSTVII